MIKSELGKGTCLPDKDLNCIDVPLEGPFTLIMPDGSELGFNGKIEADGNIVSNDGKYNLFVDVEEYPNGGN